MALGIDIEKKKFIKLSLMSLEPILQNEVSQKEKDKYCTLTHIYEIQKAGTNDPMYRAAKETQT